MWGYVNIMDGMTMEMFCLLFVFMGKTWLPVWVEWQLKSTSTMWELTLITNSYVWRLCLLHDNFTTLFFMQTKNRADKIWIWMLSVLVFDCMHDHCTTLSFMQTEYVQTRYDVAKTALVDADNDKCANSRRKKNWKNHETCSYSSLSCQHIYLLSKSIWLDH